MDVLMDGLIYEEQVQQRKVVAAFLAGYPCRDVIDRQLVAAMRIARFGLYRIEAIIAERAEIELKALVAETTDTDADQRRPREDGKTRIHPRPAGVASS
jgi:hypothetical protein